jgi:hypothetical protein
MRCAAVSAGTGAGKASADRNARAIGLTAQIGEHAWYALENRSEVLNAEHAAVPVARIDEAKG